MRNVCIPPVQLNQSHCVSPSIIWTAASCSVFTSKQQHRIIDIYERIVLGYAKKGVVILHLASQTTWFGFSAESDAFESLMESGSDNTSKGCINFRIVVVVVFIREVDPNGWLFSGAQNMFPCLWYAALCAQLTLEIKLSQSSAVW